MKAECLFYILTKANPHHPVVCRASDWMRLRTN